MPLEKFGQRGLIRKMKVLGNLRDGGFRAFQLLYDGSGQRSADVVIDRFL